MLNDCANRRTRTSCLVQGSYYPPIPLAQKEGSSMSPARPGPRRELLWAEQSLDIIRGLVSASPAKTLGIARAFQPSLERGFHQKSDVYHPRRLRLWSGVCCRQTTRALYRTAAHRIPSCTCAATQLDPVDGGRFIVVGACAGGTCCI